MKLNLNVITKDKTHWEISLLLISVFYFMTTLWVIPDFLYIYGPKGILENTPTMNRLSLYFNSQLLIVFLQLLLFLKLASSLLILSASYRRAACFTLFICELIFFNLNSLSPSPESGFMGFLLLTIGFFPMKTFDKATHDNIKNLLWLSLSAGYFYAGYAKFQDASWSKGEALFLILSESPISTTLGLSFSQIGLFWIRILNFVVMTIESTFFISYFIKRLRNFYWLSLMMTHLGILVSLKLWEVSLGMLVIHFCSYYGFQNKNSQSLH